MALKSTWRKVDELEANKQDELVSGVNIKTINSTSLLGSGNITISGGGVSDGDKGDITVSGSGSVWTIDNLAVNNAKINDVAATKVTEDSTHRFVTDTEKSTWNGKQDALVSGTNIKTIGGSSILGAGNLPIPDPAGWTTIVKSANQDVTNSATLVTDTDLQFSVVAGGHYMIELDAVISSSSTAGDYKNAFNVSAGTQKAHGLLIGTSQAGNAGVILYNANAAATSTNLTIGTIMNDLDGLLSIKVIYSFTASANATFRYQFAQNTATAAQTARTWKGSILKYKRID